MKIKEIKYGIVQQADNFLIHKKTYYLGIHLISEVLSNELTGDFEVFGCFESAKERIEEILGGKKSIKKKLKLFRRCK